jgi:hypothetical protein
MTQEVEQYVSLASTYIPRQNSALETLSEVTQMRPDRPLILSALLMGAGIGLTIAYCTGNVGLSPSYPLSGASFKLSITDFGPVAITGPALTALGLLLLVWATLCAILRQMGLFGTPEDREEEGPTRLFGSLSIIDRSEERTRQLQ